MFWKKKIERNHKKNCLVCYNHIRCIKVSVIINKINELDANGRFTLFLPCPLLRTPMMWTFWQTFFFLAVSSIQLSANFMDWHRHTFIFMGLWGLNVYHTWWHRKIQFWWYQIAKNGFFRCPYNQYFHKGMCSANLATIKWEKAAVNHLH